MRRTAFLASPHVWAIGHGPDHPLKPERLRRTYELLDEYGALEAPNVQVVPPRHASPDELTLFHAPAYVEAVQAFSRGERLAEAARFSFGPGDNPIFGGMYDTERLKVGSALQAAALVLSGECDVAFSYSGGLHHGGPDFASGFCVFNDAAVAIQWLLNQGQRVAYVDVDVHHGDGVQAAFYDSDRVLTISLHQDPRTLFPGTGSIHETGEGPGAGFSANVPLPPYTPDEAYLQAFHAVVPPLLDRFAPDVVVTQLGVDTHRLDPLANLALTTRGHEAIFRALSELSPRWLALGGGGYHMDVVPRSWALAFGVMSGNTLPEELPEGYRARYGGSSLHDSSDEGLPETLRRRTHLEVEAVIARVQAAHDLAG